MKNNKELVILAGRGSGDTPVTVDSELSQSSTNPVQNQAIYRALANKEDIQTSIAVSGTTPTIEPQANTIYNCGELSSLTISNPPMTGAYSIVFTSGATATDCDFPDSLQWQNDTVPTINPNKTYEIIVTNNRAVCGEFPVAGVSA